MSSLPRSVIVGTAGHIDHGKSSLVEALTGTHPDRLEEEKRRGITIDLGFAFLEEGGVNFGFVDVPGHERFVSNMLAGAAGIDIVLLVIAADESIKPQTREHFDICRLLGISRGIVALTKTDLVDAETRELVSLEVADYLRGTFLENAPIIPVSAKTGEGIQELKRALQKLAAEIPIKDARRHFRLPIDRSFAIKGFGTVVTGTLISGSVAPGDQVELLPQGDYLRVRGLQSGGRNVEQAVAGQRTAVNLSGIEHTAIKRGMALVVPGRFRGSRRMDVRLQLLKSAPKLKQRSKVHLHTSSAEATAEVFLYERSVLQPGEDAYGQLRLNDALPVLKGDRFIARQFSPVVTIGGGIILDPLARRPLARDASRLKFLGTLENGTREEILAAMLARAPFGLTFAEIAARMNWLDAEIIEVARELVNSGQAKHLSSDPLLLLASKDFEQLRFRLAETIANFHRENPLSPGMPREDLRISLGRRVRQVVFRAVLEALVAEKKIELAGELVRKAGAAIALQPEEARSKEQIEAAFAKAGLAVPSVREVLSQLPVEPKRAEKLLQLLLRENNLVRVTPELVFHPAALRQLREKLQEYRKAKGERITVPVFKELTGITRKYAIPLLEYLDRERVTRRAGDERVIL
ncbi:MAG TPA: selenocysteine-specific translation elongation factor [Terriglobales bacterium]|nr:selenocysteine-specific translation elongation factor [Terriglobales bacterium]